jgi:hypothetical protein
VAFEHGQLVAQGGISPGRLVLTGQNKKNESNRNHNRTYAWRYESAVIDSKNQRLKTR